VSIFFRFRMSVPMSSSEALAPWHHQRERHFRWVSRAYLALGAAALVAAGASLGTATPQTSLYTQAPVLPAISAVTDVRRIAPAPLGQPLMAQRSEDLSAADGATMVSVGGPVPSPSLLPGPLAGGVLAALACAAAAAVTVARRRPSTPLSSMAADPTFIMASAAGEEPTLLRRPVAKQSTAQAASFVTIEYQRKQAKALFDHFEALEQEALQKEGRRLGWTASNEVVNGRWVMFGFFFGPFPPPPPWRSSIASHRSS